MQSIAGVGVARVRALPMLCSFNRFREEIAASPHPAVLRTSTLPARGRVIQHRSRMCRPRTRSIRKISPRSSTNTSLLDTRRAPSGTSGT